MNKNSQPTLDKKFLSVIILLAVAAVFSWKFSFQQYIQADTVSIHSFPKEINGWTAVEMDITEDEYAILETRNAFVRRYTSPDGRAVTLFVIYSQNNRKVSHPPEICYSGGGNTVVSKKLREIVKADGSGLLIKANELYLESSVADQVSFYWFKVGREFTPSYWKQQFLIAVHNIIGKKASSAMVRVSSVVVADDAVKSENDVIEFSRSIIPELFKYLP